MKKTIAILLILISITITGCISTTTEQLTMTEDSRTSITTTTSTSTSTTTETTQTLTTSFVAATSVSLETEEVTFVVEVDSNTIDETNDVITVLATITTKVAVNQELGTSTHGEEGIIGIRIISIDDSETILYSDVYDILTNAAMLNVSLESGESLSRTMQFARMPFNGGMGGEEPSPVGIYKVQVLFYSQEAVWLDTGIIITVE